MPAMSLPGVCSKLVGDLSSLLGTLRQAIFEDRGVPLHPYNGAERRSDQDRRKGERRGRGDVNSNR